MSFGITALFYVLTLQTAAKRRWESEGIGVTRPTVPPSQMHLYNTRSSIKRSGLLFILFPAIAKR